MTTLYEERLQALAASAVTGAAWDPHLHPRARNGQFIKVGGWVRGLFRVGGSTEKLNGKVLSIDKNNQHPSDPLIKVMTKHGPLSTTSSQISEAVKPKGFLSKIVEAVTHTDAEREAYKKKSLDGDVAFAIGMSMEGRDLNGVPLSEVNFDPHSVPDVDVGEPPLEALPPGAKQSAGVVIEEPDGRVWLYEPLNHFGGYRYTFSKGRIDEGETAQQAALREAYEEIGLVAEITGYVGDYEGTTTTTRLYRGRRIGGAPWKPNQEAVEVAEVRLAPPDKAAELLHTERDAQILSDLTGDSSYVEPYMQERERRARKAFMERTLAEEVGKAFGVKKPSQQSLLERTTQPKRQSMTADKMLAKWKPGL